MINFGHWTYHTEFEPDDYVGFIYRINCLVTGNFYIGRKQLWSNTTKPPLKGQKRRRKFRKESDWKDYTSSSKEMNELISLHGKERFEFIIICLCVYPSDMAYWETAHIIMTNSMTDPLGLNKNCSRVPCPPKSK